MKIFFKFAMMMALVAVISQTACADKSVNISQLPTTAQSFIQKHYKGIAVRECEKDLDDGEFDVELRNGVDLTFDKDGNLLVIDAGRKKVDISILKEILPAKAYSELENRGVSNKVEEVEFNPFTIKVDLRQRVNDEYRFDNEGNLISVED